MDQRKSSRLPITLKAAIAPVDYRHQEVIDCLCRDISKSGCFLVTPHKFLLGDRVRVEINLDHNLVVSLLSRVAWIRHLQRGKKEPLGVGIQFLTGQDEDYTLLESFINELIRNPPAPENP